jgi:hypothetical protein
MKNFEYSKLRCGGDDLSYMYIGVHLNFGSNPKMEKMLKQTIITNFTFFGMIISCT